jgi:putative ABC transport system permease protein
VWSVDPQQSFYRVATLDELLAKSLAPRRFLLLVSAAFACTALALAVAGLYGLVSFLTARRTQEIGVRVALGAGNGDIFRMVVGEGMALVGVGLGVGLVAVFGAGRAMESALFGVSPADPTAGAAVVLLLAAVAFAACAVPALRASRTDPIAALRND